jgi:hypothetical protein
MTFLGLIFFLILEGIGMGATMTGGRGFFSIIFFTTGVIIAILITGVNVFLGFFTF